MRIRSNNPQKFHSYNKTLKLEADNIKDTVDLNSPVIKNDGFIENSRKLTTIGTAVGAVTGKVMLPVAAGLMGASAGGAVGGSIGTTVGALSGFLLGKIIEKKTNTGRILGGIAGGFIGNTGARIKGKKEDLDISSLASKLSNTFYTSQKNFTREEVKELKKLTQPGDILLLSSGRERSTNAQLLQEFSGQKGDWGHIAMVTDKLTVLDSNPDGILERPWERFLPKFSRLMILRPSYKDKSSLNKTIKEARRLKDTARYDFKYSLQTDDELYCVEYIYKALQKGSPEIDIKEYKALGVIPAVGTNSFAKSPSMEVVYSTGSNIWDNILSKFE